MQDSNVNINVEPYTIYSPLCVIHLEQGVAACGFDIANRTMTHRICRPEDPGWDHE